MLKRFLILILALVVVAVAGVSVSRVQNTRAKEALIESRSLKALSAADIVLVLKSQAGPGAADISSSPETRRAFLKGIEEYLALAAEARREGMTEDTNFKVNFEHKKNLLLADLYVAKLTGEQGSPYIAPKEMLELVWSAPANEKQFETDMKALRSIQAAVAKERSEDYTELKLQGGSLVKARDNWSRTKILSDRAKADVVFMARPEIGLRTRILEAGILSADYLRKHWAKNILANKADIAAYLADHPEYDVNKKREKAEMILQRAKAGEEFGGLAAEFSEDRSTKEKGGLHESIEKGMLWAEVETAALSLENGRVADRLIETETGYHIVKLESKKSEKSGLGSVTFRYSVRHILLQKKFEDPGNLNPDIPSPFLTAEEIAKSEVEKLKRNRFVNQIVQRGEISLPEDFVIEL